MPSSDKLRQASHLLLPIKLLYFPERLKKFLTPMAHGPFIPCVPRGGGGHTALPWVQFHQFFFLISDVKMVFSLLNMYY